MLKIFLEKCTDGKIKLPVSGFVGVLAFHHNTIGQPDGTHGRIPPQFKSNRGILLGQIDVFTEPVHIPPVIEQDPGHPGVFLDGKNQFRVELDIFFPPSQDDYCPDSLALISYLSNPRMELIPPR
jgi:hypothetical protein